MAGRELADWLDAYLEYTFNSEPPLTYHTWCGLSVIGGALQRKAFLQWGFERIFPNMYVVLIGPSGRARKGVALGIAKDLISNVPGVSVAPEAVSREAVILAMKRAISNYQDPIDDKVKFHCSLTAFSEELSVFLGQGDIKFLANLTDWYDSKDEWAYETVGRGRDALQGVCFNLMGATAPEWIQSMLPQEAIGGGFTSRVIFVVEEKKGKTIPKHMLTKEELALKAALQRDLERITQLGGQFQFTGDGEIAYIDWYKEQDILLGQGHMPVADSRFSGYCERRATHLRKLMMLCSASHSDHLLISEGDFIRAKGILEKVEQKMSRTFGGLGKSEYSDCTEQVIQYLKNVGSSTRSGLMTKFYRDIDASMLKVIEENLTQMGVLHITLLPSSGDKMYTWMEGGKGETH